MQRPSLQQVIETVDLLELFVTLQPHYSLVAAVDTICDLEGIPGDTDRRAIRRLLERRLALLPPRRAAA